MTPAERSLGALAFVLVMLMMWFGPNVRDYNVLQSRLNALESKKCILMAVSTPTGTASICASVQ